MTHPRGRLGLAALLHACVKNQRDFTNPITALICGSKNAPAHARFTAVAEAARARNTTHASADKAATAPAGITLPLAT